MPNNMKSAIDYRNKFVLAPMVRVGTLPMRLLALEYGADLVYTEEIIDWKLLRTERHTNEVLGTVDYIDKTDGTVVFRTCPDEREKVILQIGTASVERAVAVGLMMQNDVAAIDVNMGCPKDFSIKGGMGVALLYDRPRAKAILEGLVQSVSIPVTCKIRVMPDPDETIQLAKDLESTGISAIGVHGRTKTERPRDPVNEDAIARVATALHIPVIANGGSQSISRRHDIVKFAQRCSTTSVMVARAAEWNCSVFRTDGPLPLDDVIRRYLELSVRFDNSPSNTKYCVQMMLRSLQESPTGRRLLDSQTMQQICDIWELGDYCRETQLRYHFAGIKGRRACRPRTLSENGNHMGADDSEPAASKKQCLEKPPAEQEIDPEPLIEENVCFIRSNFTDDNTLPKSKLYLHAVRNGLARAQYEVQQKDKLFRAFIRYDGKRYTSSFWEKNKRYAEQAAALVCLLKLGAETREELIRNGAMLPTAKSDTTDHQNPVEHNGKLNGAIETNGTEYLPRVNGKEVSESC
ncbi:tRNA-dihydrouridine(20) synthase [NAD(P)+]-like [Anopheles maculipalpis]|uniref:tRNA-dihydrouridine(20) synthase [NAD(P)+]-like n=1 Tax=Anopheles maculipalpis TaxID=1496333 RepID=UPI0021598148|nr:tRNA-dihydrouridine(20) synthase [NAD(P)+]-like [Anopheles maculipalpis]